MGNVMLLKTFETSLSIVYKVKGEVKVKRDGTAEHRAGLTRQEIHLVQLIRSKYFAFFCCDHFCILKMAV